MGEFIGAIGQGIAGLVSGALQAIASILRGMANTLESILPGGWLFVVVFFVALGGAWALAKR
jgi:hypothetical protein